MINRKINLSRNKGPEAPMFNLKEDFGLVEIMIK